MERKIPRGLKDGLVLWIPGDVSGSTAYDASGNGNHGTLVNSPTPTRGGLYGLKGVKLDGTDDYVTVADSATLDLSSGLTLSVTVSITSATAFSSVFYKGLDNGF